MNQNEQGVLYPFRLSGSRLRRSAVQLHRQGQMLDALTLVRRAAEQEGTPAAWQALAAELHRMGNWEAAARILCRVLAMEPHQPGVWADLAACMHALGQFPLAADCAYHQLREDPWSPEGDAARALLAEVNGELLDEHDEPHRVARLIHRGAAAWQNGSRTLGEQRIRRAIRLAKDPQRLLSTAAMLCMVEQDLSGALRYLAASLREDPHDARTLIALSMLYHQMGKPRAALGFLQRASAYAETPMEEDSFLTAAWAQDAWPETKAFLDVHTKRRPYRLALMSAKATMCSECDDLPAAQMLWRDMLAIDPQDRTAATMIAWTQKASETGVLTPGMLPRPEKKRQQMELRALAERMNVDELLQYGGKARQLLEWMLQSSDAEENQLGKTVLEALPPCEKVALLLKELLCRPGIHDDVRQWALVRLAEMGETELLVLSGGRYNLIQCRPISERKHQQPWRLFLPMLLQETRQYHKSREVVEFAADCWRCMSETQRMEAAGSGRYAWCKAMEILYLRQQGEDALAVLAAQEGALSIRRISRVLRRLMRCMQENDMKQ